MDARTKLSVGFAMAVVLMLAYLGYGKYDGVVGTLGLTRDTLATTRRERDTLAYLSLTLGNKLKQSDLDKLKAENIAKDARIGQQDAEAEVVRKTRLLSAAQAQIDADRYVAGVGAVSTTTDRDSLYRQVAQLKNLHIVKDTVISQLNRANASQSVTIRRQEDQLSDLERALNGKDAHSLRVQQSIQDEIENASGLFKTGRRKALKRVQVVAKGQ